MARSSDSVFPLSLIRDRTFQAREIRRVIKLSIVYLVVTTVLVGVFYHQMLGRLIEGVAPLLFVSEDMALATEVIPPVGTVLVKWLVAMLLVNVAITAVLGVWITRRLGQPLLAIKRTLREIENGNLDVRLRTSDSREFGELAEALSEAMHAVRHKIAEAQRSAADGAHEQTRAALDWFQVDSANEADVTAKADDDGTRAA